MLKRGRQAQTKPEFADHHHGSIRLQWSLLLLLIVATIIALVAGVTAASRLAARQKVNQSVKPSPHLASVTPGATPSPTATPTFTPTKPSSASSPKPANPCPRPNYGSEGRPTCSFSVTVEHGGGAFIDISNYTNTNSGPAADIKVYCSIDNVCQSGSNWANQSTPMTLGTSTSAGGGIDMFASATVTITAPVSYDWNNTYFGHTTCSYLHHYTFTNWSWSQTDTKHYDVGAHYLDATGCN